MKINSRIKLLMLLMKIKLHPSLKGFLTAPTHRNILPVSAAFEPPQTPPFLGLFSPFSKTVLEQFQTIKSRNFIDYQPSTNW